MVVYSPWANGTVKSLMQPDLAALRALTMEMRLAPSHWKWVLPLVATALNWALLDRLGQRGDGITRSLLEVFTGIQPSRSACLFSDKAGAVMSIQLAQNQAASTIRIPELQTDLQGMYQEGPEAAGERRQKAIRAKNETTHVMAPKFDICDFGLVQEVVEKGQKFTPKERALSYSDSPGITCF